ncbi:MAG: TatD family hydrolase [Candidatus Krumholzibacteriia bacterium]
MELIDTHCHLYDDPLGRDPEAVLARARAAGVTRVIVPAWNMASWAATAALAVHAGVYPALGLHPWAADEPLDTGRLRAELQACGAVAVGEIGLDALVDGADLPAQTRVLAAQLRLAGELRLPVLLHCRGAFEELIRVLRDHGFGAGPDGPRGVVHAFARGPELAARFVGLGLHLAFGGAVTRPGSRARRSAVTAPAERLVLETDAPAIGLHEVEPAQVEPRHVREVAAALAELRGEPPERIAEVTTANARALFGI